MMSMFYVTIYVHGIYIPSIVLILKLYTMFTLMLGFPVAMSDAKDWTPFKKGLAILQIILIDAGVMALCCW